MALLPPAYRHRSDIGEEVAFNHEECGDTRGRLFVKRTMRGWTHHCHNCAPEMSGFTPMSGVPTPSETLRALQSPKENQVVTASEIKLPSDFTTEIPERGLAWLYKYGMTDEEIHHFGFGFGSGRLILPVYGDADGLVYWQGRNLGEVTKSNPKYINVRAGGRDVWFRCTNVVLDNGGGMLEQPCAGGSISDLPPDILGSSDCRKCVLVEDILSAIKVGRVTSSIGLLGSYIPQSLTRNLVDYDEVLIWLDRDKAKESIKYARRLNAVLGKPVRPIITDKDPKEYTTEEIRRYVQGR